MPTALTIFATDGTTLTLDTDAAMPEQGFDAGVSLRSVETWYPGSSLPSVQIMGTREEPITIKGQWRDSLLGLVGGAQANANTARQLVLRQLPVRLVWSDDTGAVVLDRDGLLSSFIVTWRRGDAIGWALTLTVTQATESQVLAVPAPPVPDPYALADALRAVIAAAEAVAEAAILANNVLRAVL